METKIKEAVDSAMVDKIDVSTMFRRESIANGDDRSGEEMLTQINQYINSFFVLIALIESYSIGFRLGNGEFN